MAYITQEDIDYICLTMVKAMTIEPLAYILKIVDASISQDMAQKIVRKIHTTCLLVVYSVGAHADSGIVEFAHATGFLKCQFLLKQRADDMCSNEMLAASEFSMALLELLLAHGYIDFNYGEIGVSQTVGDWSWEWLDCFLGDEYQEVLYGCSDSIRPSVCVGMKTCGDAVWEITGSGYYRCLRLLLEYGAPIHINSTWAAAEDGNLRCLRLLLEHNAQIHPHAVWSVTQNTIQEKHMACIRLMLEYGATIYADMCVCFVPNCDLNSEKGYDLCRTHIDRCTLELRESGMCTDISKLVTRFV